MLGRTYDGQDCSLARALELVGERWTLLIIRDALLGVRRFDDFQTSLGVARNVLADRLQRLVTHDVLTRVRYQQRPERFEYRLTPRGQALVTGVIALMQWGDGLPESAGPPRRLVEHADCGSAVTARIACPRCARAVSPDKVTVRPNPAYAS